MLKAEGKTEEKELEMFNTKFALNIELKLEKKSPVYKFFIFLSSKAFLFVKYYKILENTTKMREKKMSAKRVRSSENINTQQNERIG